jgi:hypothetical protein
MRSREARAKQNQWDAVKFAAVAVLSVGTLLLPASESVSHRTVLYCNAALGLNSILFAFLAGLLWRKR